MIISCTEHCIGINDMAVIEQRKEKSKQEVLVPKSALQKCFDYLKKRWQKCIMTEGGYFDGDRIVINK